MLSPSPRASRWVRENNHSQAFLWFPPTAQAGEGEKRQHSSALKQKGKIRTATPPPHHLPLVSLPPLKPQPSKAHLRSPGRPLGRGGGQIRAQPPPPPQLSVLQLRRQEWGWGPPPQLCEDCPPHLAWQGGPDRGRGPRAPGLPPSPSRFPARTRLPSPAPNLFLLPAPRLPPPPPPPQVPPGSRAAASSLSPSRPPRSWSAGPLPGSLLPSLHLAPEAATATGAVLRTPTPSPGYFPPPRSREKSAVASGSSRETHHHGSGCSRSSRVLKLRLGGGLCGGCKIRRLSVEKCAR